MNIASIQAKNKSSIAIAIAIAISITIAVDQRRESLCRQVGDRSITTTAIHVSVVAPPMSFGLLMMSDNWQKCMNSDHPLAGAEASLTMTCLHQMCDAEEVVVMLDSPYLGAASVTVEERVQRERLRDLSVFERLNGSSVKTSPSLAVKKFCRTISTKNVQASDVRPLPVLEDTLNYLLNLLDTKEHPFEVVHDFIFDRTRSIRQDLSMQNIINNRVIQMFEKMRMLCVLHFRISQRENVFFPLTFSLIRGAKKAGFAPATAILGKPKELPKERGAVSPLAFGEERAEKKTSFAQVKFHVISHHKLRRCSNSPNISSKYYLNMEQLTKALTSLYHLYEANRNIQSIYENEAEFRSLYVLLHLGCDNKPMGQSLSFWFCHVASPIIKSKEMCFARIVLRYYRFGNYKRFICTTAAEASYLQYCIIEPYINEIRVLAVSCVNFGGYKLHPYPLADLSKLLMMKESDVESFCHDCGLETSTDEVGNKFLPTKQTSFCHPKGGFQNYCLCVFAKMKAMEDFGS
ncbi:hypothetical protein HYC85_010380 [Camellia sinensis]|uniref:SAC3/GANP/THP3 conserved domain-containing protein n=1 Tax=Camellia sinensis TaxID=4442 RepID=A0A7J7HKH0_CAMSI|nr:hypothetical protein HYC85_010380 [Camellia sinensis]